jgi:hypothetical protein
MDIDRIGRSITESAKGGEVNNEFWDATTKAIWFADCKLCLHMNRTTNNDIRDIVYTPLAEKVELYKDVEGCQDAYIYLTGEDSRTSGNATVTYTTKMRFITKYIEDMEGRKTLNPADFLDQKGVSKVFFVNLEEVSEYVAPFLSIIMEYFASEIMRLVPDVPDRRVYISIDEAPKLMKLPKLLKLLPEGAKFGVMVILSFQTAKDWISVYSEEDLQTMLNNTANKVFFATGDTDTRKLMSEIIGDRTFLHVTSTTNISPHQRDGKGFNENRITEPAVPPSEISKLKKHEFLYNLLGYDWVRSTENRPINDIEESFTGFIDQYPTDIDPFIPVKNIFVTEEAKDNYISRQYLRKMDAMKKQAIAMGKEWVEPTHLLTHISKEEEEVSQDKSQEPTSNEEDLEKERLAKEMEEQMSFDQPTEAPEQEIDLPDQPEDLTDLHSQMNAELEQELKELEQSMIEEQENTSKEEIPESPASSEGKSKALEDLNSFMKDSSYNSSK